VESQQRALLRLSSSTKALILDFSWAFVVLVVFCLVSDWRRANPGKCLIISHDMSESMGAEYNAIAAAIVSGKGFSDPFMTESGPTAWMPPVLPAIMALCYGLCSDDRSYVILLLRSLQASSIYFTAILFLRISRRFHPFGLGHVILPIGLLTEFHGLFQRLDDSWLILMVYNLVLINAISVATTRNPSSLRSGCLTGFAALCSPIAGVVAFCSVSITILIKNSLLYRDDISRKRGKLSYLLCVSAIASVVLFPWILRNFLVLNAWIPVKSNLAFELWQSQCVDDDGVLDIRTILQHPWSFENDQRRLYLDLGEIAFCRVRWREATIAILDNPVSFIVRIRNRFSAACLVPVEYTVKSDNFLNRRIRALLYPTPFLAFIFLIFQYRDTCPVTTNVATIYFFGLIPFILISFLERYSVPLISMKMILVTVAVSRMMAAFRFKAVGGVDH